MSTETINPNEEAVVHEEQNNGSSIQHKEENDGSNSATNGNFHNDEMNSVEEQNESTKEDYQNNQQEKYDKNELEPESLRKVFIGGLSYKTDDQAFRDYFSKFGDIVVRENPKRDVYNRFFLLLSIRIALLCVIVMVDREVNRSVIFFCST